jgi:hypothetical protein
VIGSFQTSRFTVSVLLRKIYRVLRKIESAICVYKPAYLSIKYCGLTQVKVILGGLDYTYDLDFVVLAVTVLYAI